MRFILGLCFAMVVAIQSSAAEDQAADSDGMESLGRELLDDLTPDVLRQPAMPPSGPVSPAPRFDDLGEDAGGMSGPLALARVRRGMQQAESLLREPQSDSATNPLQQAAHTQQEVVDRLDDLIAELSKQCQGGDCQPGDKPPKPSQRSTPKPGKPGSAAGRGTTAARDSNARLDRSNAQAAEKGDLGSLVKDLWGHLPERSREQMLQSFSDEFLPEYELEIEQYYRGLSDETSDDRPAP